MTIEEKRARAKRFAALSKAMEDVAIFSETPMRQLHAELLMEILRELRDLNEETVASSRYGG